MEKKWSWSSEPCICWCTCNANEAEQKPPFTVPYLLICMSSGRSVGLSLAVLLDSCVFWWVHELLMSNSCWIRFTSSIKCNFRGFSLVVILSFSSGIKPPLTGRATLPGVAKRNVGEKLSDEDCVIYRYGSFCTGIEVFGELPSASVSWEAYRYQRAPAHLPPVFQRPLRRLRSYRWIMI